ncbi:MAG TPA: hypothetical protein VJH70_02705 [Candidatus Paceibacterota bacterium]
MAKRVITILLVTIMIFSMVIPFLSFGATEKPPSKNETLGEINDIVHGLIDLKDNDFLSPKEKNQEEIKIRKEALAKISALLISEIDELLVKTSSLPPTNKHASQIQIQFTNFLDSARAYVSQFNEGLLGELTLNELKIQAIAFKNWRDTYYQPNFEKLINFLLISDTQSFLVTADHRLEKIISDLKKLEGARITRRSEYSIPLNTAMESLTNANLTYYKAEKLISDILSTTSTSSLIATTHIKSLIGQSLNNIRSAYASFLDISRFIKKRIGK